MPFATWWRGDPLPTLTPLSTFSVRSITDWDSAQLVTGLGENRVQLRYQNGHRLYAAYLGDECVGFGWAAMQAGGIEELDFGFVVPPGNVYLWDFVTLPPYRGQGIYPRLLQEIVRQADEIDRFWIGFEERNAASARGIVKAGFTVVGDLVVACRRVVRFAVFAPGARARAASEMFELPLQHEP